MNCSKCGTTNSPGSRFCINCGNDLASETIQSQNANQNFNQLNNQVNPYNNHDVISKKRHYGNILMDCIMLFWRMIINPSTAYNDENNEFDDPKKSLIMTAILTVVMTISDLIKTIISVARVPKYSYSQGYSYVWNFSLIKDIKFIKIIFQDLITFAGIILAVCIVFYIGSLIIKNQLNFIKSLTISAICLVPAILGIMVLSPIFNLLWTPLGTSLVIIGFMYTIILLYEFMNEELKLEGNKKIFFFLACFSVLFIGGYYAYTRIILNSVSSIIGSL